MIEYGFLAATGAMIAGSLIVTAQYMGTTANAVTASDIAWASLSTPSSSIATKSSLLRDAPTLRVTQKGDAEAMPYPGTQAVRSKAKGNFQVDRKFAAAAPKANRDFLLVSTPPRWKLEYNWKVGKERKKQLLTKRKFRIAQHDCLARAVYFEARSESELGQIAVARVIMNRVKNSQFPDNICDVVYQGSERRNSCQFSFACDGIHDRPRDPQAWHRAKNVATRVMHNAKETRIISAATHYHADYVRPRWSGAMKRILKIGRHIFYNDS